MCILSVYIIHHHKKSKISIKSSHDTFHLRLFRLLEYLKSNNLLILRNVAILVASLRYIFDWKDSKVVWIILYINNIASVALSLFAFSCQTVVWYSGKIFVPETQWRRRDVIDQMLSAPFDLNLSVQSQAQARQRIGTSFGAADVRQLVSSKQTAKWSSSWKQSAHIPARVKASYSIRNSKLRSPIYYTVQFDKASASRIINQRQI